MRRSLIMLGILVLLIGAAVGVMRLGGLVAGPEWNPPAAEVTPRGDVSTIATGLEVPWEVAFTSEDRMLVTERPGRVRQIDKGELQGPPLLSLEVPRRGEGGLQGLAVDPDYQSNKFIYLYYSYTGGTGLLNRVARYRDTGTALVEPKTILENIPGNTNHNGGRLAFGPDKKLYLTTGDAQEPSLAQDKDSLAGKILRLNADGSAPSDNPFGNLVWSLGHRNPQGVAWDGDELYEVEHGPSGDLGLCCRDELNRIVKGGNYGWPVISGDQVRDGFVSPLLSSGSGTTWAPAGLAFFDGQLYFAALRGTALHQVTLGEKPEDKALLTTFGRLRAVTKGPDSALYVTTSNRDGRGTVQDGDDKIIRVAP